MNMLEHWRGVAAVSVGLALVFGLRCSSDGGGEEAGPQFDRRALLESIGENVILPTYRELDEAAAALRDEARAWADAVEAGEDAEAARMQARSAWRDAMDVWQRAELMRVGPAGPTGEVVGGASLGDEIYSWPESVNSCRVDQELVADEFEGDGFFDDEQVNVYGLDALEYLLFYEGEDNTCASQVGINAEGTWDALEPSELSARRAGYAAAVANHLAEDAARLVEAWQPEGDGFVEDFADAGEEGSAYESARQALDDLFAAMFYLDTATKDRKVALPAGLSHGLDLECSQAPCLDEVESPWAEHSKANIRNNLLGFQYLLLNEAPDQDEGEGFDAALAMVDAEDIAESLRADTDAALDAVDDLEGTFGEALENEPQAVEDLHAAIKALTDALKMELVMRLGLQIPASGGGDTD